MANFDGAYTGRTFYTMRLTAWESATDSANNRSTVSWTLAAFINTNGYGGTYNLDGGTWSVNINGSVYSGHHVLDFRGVSSLGYSIPIASGSTVVTHNSDGTKTISVSASDSPGTPFGSATASGSLALSRTIAPPDAPTYVSNTADGSSITLAWSPGNNHGSAIDLYAVRVWTAGYSWDSPNVYSSTTTGTSLRIGGLSPTTRYYWGTSAHNQAGWSPASNTGTGWYIDTTVAPPAAPAAPTVSEITATSAKVTMVMPANGGGAITDTGLALYTVAAGGTPVATDVGVDTKTSWTFSGLASFTDYWAEAWAINSAGAGARSPRTPLKTLAGPPAAMLAPAAPTDVWPTFVTLVAIQAAPANGGSPITSYDLAIGTDPAFSAGTFVTLHPTPTDVAKAYLASGTAPGKVLTARIRANNAIGNGPWSSTVSFVSPSLEYGRVGAWRQGRQWAKVGNTQKLVRVWKKVVDTWQS